MKGVQYRDRVGEFVADGVGVAAEGVECGLLDGGLNVQALGLKLVGVDRAGTALDGIRRGACRQPVVVAGQVNRDRDGPVAAAQPPGRSSSARTATT